MKINQPEDEDSYDNDFLKSSGFLVSIDKKKEEDLRKFNSPISGVSSSHKTTAVVEQEQKESTESVVEEVAEDEEYKDDDFEQDSQKSGTLAKGQLQGTLSQSGLPPLASGKFNAISKMGTTVNNIT